MAGKNGGARPGAGRPKLALTVKKVDPKIINAGILPLQMRLMVARKLWAEAVNEAGEIVDMPKAKEAAEFAEPAMRYTSAALQSVFMSAPDGGPVEHRHTVVNEVEAMIADEMNKAGDKRPAATRH